jgi:hypothetical protein
MARRRIFAKRRTPRWPLAAALSIVLVGLASAGGVTLLRLSSSEIPACSAAEVRHELKDLLRDQPGLSEASDLQVLELDERKQVFGSDRMLARDCAATAEVDGAIELIRFRIMHDDEQGYVLSVPGI